MSDYSVDVRTEADGSLVVRLSGRLDTECAVSFRQLLVHSVRKVRPLRLVVELDAVAAVDPINVGSLAAVCELGDDHQVVVFLADPPPAIRSDLLAAGVPAQRLRYTRDTEIADTPEVASMS